MKVKVSEYEAMCVFPADDEPFKKGVDVLRDKLKEAGGEIVQETHLGIRAFAYPIRKETHGNYYYYVVKMEPAQAKKLEATVQHIEELMRFLVMRV